MKKVTRNLDQSLYVIPFNGGCSCLGFDVCMKRGTALAAELKEPFNVRRGTLAAYKRYSALVEMARQANQKTGFRSESDLTPQLKGLEGCRVEVVDSYGEKRRFIVGKSTGWIPCHLEIKKNNSSGGMGVTGAPFKSVLNLGRVR